MALGFSFGSILIVSIGVFGQLREGHKNRWSDQVIDILKAPDIASARCHGVLTSTDIEANRICNIGAPNVVPSFALIGDSHAGALIETLNLKAVQSGLSFLSFTAGWCLPFYGIHNPSNPDCEGLIDKGLELIVKSNSIQTVILHAEWAAYSSGFRHDSPLVAYSDSMSKLATADLNHEVFIRGLHRTLVLLKNANKRVIVIGPVPEHILNVKLGLSRAIHFNRSIATLPSTFGADYVGRNDPVVREFEKILPLIDYVDTARLFCKTMDTQCDIVDEAGHPLYSDGNHITAYGALRIINKLDLSK